MLQEGAAGSEWQWLLEERTAERAVRQIGRVQGRVKLGYSTVLGVGRCDAVKLAETA